MTVEVRELGEGRWQLSCTTTAPASHVFELVADLGRHAEWETDLSDVALVRGRPGEAGARYVKRYGRRGTGMLARLTDRRPRVECRVRAVEPGRRVEWEQRVMRSSPESFDRQVLDLTLTSSPDRTTVVLVRQVFGLDVPTLRAVAGLQDVIRRAAERAGDDDARHLGEWRDADVRGQALEAMPARGPGTASLERLRDLAERSAR